MWIVIEPNDVLLFRGSRPFSAGQNFVARSSFPPNPQVMTGAVRASVIRNSSVSFDDYKQGAIPDDLQQKIGLPPQLGGDEGSLGNLKLTGPFVCKIDGETGNIERLFPMPQDVLFDENRRQFVTLQPSKQFANSIQTPLPFEGWKPLLIPNQTPALSDDQDESFESIGHWLTETGMQTYLQGGIIPLKDTIPANKVTVTESHIGIAIDYRRRATIDRRFYRAEFNRVYETSPAMEAMKNLENPDEDTIQSQADYRIGLMLNLTDGSLPEQGYLTLGGERRFASYRATKEPAQIEHAAEAGNIKVTLLTPAYFLAGWQPGTDNTLNVWSQWLGNDAKLVSIASAPPTIISGWDIANNRPKPLYRYMPAGSVYYFENATWQDKPFTQNPTSLDAGAMGFGTVAISQWNYLTENQHPEGVL